MPENSIGDWLPTLLDDQWSSAVTELQNEGVTIPVTEKPTFLGAKDQDTEGSSIRNRTKVKVFQDGGQDNRPLSWDDGDEDILVTVTVMAEAGGEEAVDRRKSVKRVLERILKNQRNQPNADWDRIESTTTRLAQDYADYQRLMIDVNLAARGRLLP